MMTSFFPQNRGRRNSTLDIACSGLPFVANLPLSWILPELTQRWKTRVEFS